MNAPEARKITRSAATVRAAIQDQKPANELIKPFVRQRVPLLWSRLDRREARTEGKQSPDKGVIEEIDPLPRPVFFTDEMLSLKNQMIGDDENPYQKLYFVDVEVSVARGKVANYRVVGFHGTEDLGS